MANYKQAYRKVMEIEKFVYTDDKDDLGGETYAGITRKYWPKWAGWKVIDSLRSNPSFPKNLNTSMVLHDDVMFFYKDNFWDYFKADKIESQAIAEELFECGVNVGCGVAAKYLQRTLNILNNKERLYKNIKVDGGIGDITLGTLKTAIQKRGEKLIFNILNYHQANHYIDLMESKEDQEKFVGWFKRVEIIK